MLFLVFLWRLLSLLNILYFSAVLAELNYHDPGRSAADLIFTNTAPEHGLIENDIADSSGFPPLQYEVGDNIIAKSRVEATTDEANNLQLNIAIAPPSDDQAPSPESSSWLSRSEDCLPLNKNQTPNDNNNKKKKKRRWARRQLDRICNNPMDSNMENQQLTPGTEAGTQPAPGLVISPPNPSLGRKPIFKKKPNSAPRPRPLLKGSPLQANEWVCNHRTMNYPVCADYEHATEMPLGSGLYELFMAKLCEDIFLWAFPSNIICCPRTGRLAFPYPPSPGTKFGTLLLADRILQLCIYIVI